MQIIAKLNNLRISPRKVRLVANLIKGMDVEKAASQLRFINKRSSLPLLKLLNSASSNAKNNFNLSSNDLYISGIKVDSGANLKRWLPRAFGRATPILKRSSHITLTLSLKGERGKDFKEFKKEEKKKEKISKIEPEKTGVITALREKKEEMKVQGEPPKRPYRASPRAKKRFFSRQTFSNIKKVFRRKSI